MGSKEVFHIVFDLLKTSGVFIVEFPDVLKFASGLWEYEPGSYGYIEAMRAIHAFGLDDMAKDSNYIPYSFSWSYEHLRKELREVGFNNIQKLVPLTHDTTGKRDTRLEAVK